MGIWLRTYKGAGHCLAGNLSAASMAMASALDNAKVGKMLKALGKGCCSIPTITYPGMHTTSPGEDPQNVLEAKVLPQAQVQDLQVSAYLASYTQCLH